MSTFSPGKQLVNVVNLRIVDPATPSIIYEVPVGRYAIVKFAFLADFNDNGNAQVGSIEVGYPNMTAGQITSSGKILTQTSPGDSSANLDGKGFFGDLYAGTSFKVATTGGAGTIAYLIVEEYALP